MSEIMFAISKPELDIDSVFDACVNSIQNPYKRNRMLGIKSYIRGCYKVYNIHAIYSLLYYLTDEHSSNAACNATNATNATNETKDKLVKLYEQQMVKNKEGRKQYDDNAQFLIAASQVIAIHYQTVAKANNYWMTE